MGLQWNLIRQRSSLLFITEISSSNTPSWWAHLNLRKSITDWHIKSPCPPLASPHLPVFIAVTQVCVHTHMCYVQLDFSDVALGRLAGKWKLWKSREDVKQHIVGEMRLGVSEKLKTYAELYVFVFWQLFCAFEENFHQFYKFSYTGSFAVPHIQMMSHQKLVMF